MNKARILEYFHTNETVRHILYPDVDALMQIYINDSSFTFYPTISFDSMAEEMYSIYINNKIDEVLND